MTIKTGLHPFKCIFFSLITIFSPITSADPSAAMGYSPKYPANFKHFDYIDPNAKKGGRLVLAGTGAFDSFNPFILKGVAAEGTGLLFDTLMVASKDEPFSKYPLIANDIQLAKDKLSVTFKIDKRARFNNGDKITAEDVKFSFDTVMSDKAHPQFKFMYGDVKDSVVVDKYTVRFNFKRLNSELHLILGDISIFSKKWIDGTSFDKLTEVKPVASGPYTIKEYDLGKRITYQRNKNYWANDLASRKGQYNFEEIQYKYYQDLVISLEAFKAGDFEFRHEYYSKLWAREHNGPNYDSGNILKENLSHSNNAGMQGFVFNTRKALFKDPAVRRAITLAFDFEWSNDHLFYNQYVVNDSYFSNSELQATGLPAGKELALLNQYRDQLPDVVFTQPWQAVSTESPNSLRQNLRKARDLLHKAGWRVKDNVLVNKKGQPLIFDVLLAQKGMDRILAPFARNLSKLGIKMNYRTVDRSLYIRRLRSFDYYMVVGSFPESMSPGNELRNMFHSIAVEKKGSRNFMGVNDPVVDALVEKIISSDNREDLVIACRALDRVLLNGNYLVPNWYIDSHRIAYWDKFNRPEKTPLYYNPEQWMISSWWLKD
ncbi:MAG: ABC transporter substrate-binding protein [endosymbiont of Galathealinum brachiosum]|uniref:ABC transporter substrate-binding protein n=1 Tax=endosymbiont of Galathealinum brachiosum TaxID=2200906 RepID=A0A370DJG5_9GAMM|nr:MAG: ABC transporter substrate-binding protein [endosymbiont of Galathealinum brachiosum]